MHLIQFYGKLAGKGLGTGKRGERLEYVEGKVYTMGIRRHDGDMMGRWGGGTMRRRRYGVGSGGYDERDGIYHGD
jgi:hypothetical protein